MICWSNKFIFGTQERPQWWHKLYNYVGSWCELIHQATIGVQFSVACWGRKVWMLLLWCWHPLDRPLAIVDSLQKSLCFKSISTCLCWGLFSCLCIAVWTALHAPHKWLHLCQIWQCHQPLLDLSNTVITVICYGWQTVWYSKVFEATEWCNEGCKCVTFYI